MEERGFETAVSNYSDNGERRKRTTQETMEKFMKWNYTILLKAWSEEEEHMCLFFFE